MKQCKKSFTMMLGMFLFIISFFMMGNISADAASNEGYFTYVSYGGGIKITSYTGAEDVLSIPASIDKKNVVAIGSDIVKNKAWIKSIVLPANVLVIDKDAFKGCTAVTKVAMGNKVASIGDNAFYGCTSLTSVTFGGAVRSIGTNAFFNCTSLTSVIVPANVETIGTNAFRGCKELNSVIIENGVKNIGAYAFGDCIRLANITIPTSVTSIGANAFNNIYVDAIFHVLSGTYADKYIIERNKTEANPSKITYVSKVPVSSLSFKYPNANLTLYVGQTANLALQLNKVPSNTTDMIYWKSFDPSKVTVDNFGLLTAKASGSVVTVKAIANNGTTDTKNATLNVRILPAPTKVILAEKGKSVANSVKKLEVNKMITLAATLQPVAAKYAPVKYSTSNPAIASVDRKTGVVKGLREGNVIITAETYNGKLATYQLQVYKNRTNLKDWDIKELTLLAGKTYAFQGLKGMSYKSSKTSIAVVNAAGVITAKKAGTATITIFNDTSQATCKVTVKAKPAKGKITSAKVSGKKVTLKWKKQSGISGYKVYYKTKDESKYKAIAANRNSKQTSYKFTSLKSKTTYYFKVQNYTKIGTVYYYGPYSAVKKVTTK